MAVEDFQPIRKWLKKLPWRAKPRLPCERALKTVSETGVKSDLAFCLGSLNEKTNSEALIKPIQWLVTKSYTITTKFKFIASTTQCQISYIFDTPLFPYICSIIYSDCEIIEDLLRSRKLSWECLRRLGNTISGDREVLKLLLMLFELLLFPLLFKTSCRVESKLPLLRFNSTPS